MLLIMQIFLISSERVKTHLVISNASWGVAGSKSGISANLEKCLASSSLVLLIPEGSSHVIRARPPFVPERLRLVKKSDTTFTPFCFMATIALHPAKDAAVAHSNATFSFTDHST